MLSVRPASLTAWQASFSQPLGLHARHLLRRTNLSAQPSLRSCRTLPYFSAKDRSVSFTPPEEALERTVCRFRKLIVRNWIPTPYSKTASKVRSRPVAPRTIRFMRANRIHRGGLNDATGHGKTQSSLRSGWPRTYCPGRRLAGIQECIEFATVRAGLRGLGQTGEGRQEIFARASVLV